MTEEDCDCMYKVVLVGDAGVGKTHLLSRYIKGTLPKNPQSTIGVEFATRPVTLPTGAVVKAQLWDTAGQERFRAITSVHYRGAVGGMLVYDITNEKSFLNARRWLQDLREHSVAGIVVMLIGNKLDLAKSSPAARKVPTETAQQFARDNGLLFEEASALTVTHVKEGFERLLHGSEYIEIHQRKIVAVHDNFEHQKIVLSGVVTKKDGCCQK